jgi:hypothetical protein
MGLPLPGNQVQDICANAKSEVILTAPFIKLSALVRLFSVIPEDIKITCITRWRLEELAAGVSDIEVWTFLQKRKNTSLLLRQNLHAKYYRADDLCLIGSANITLKALGWSAKPNLELLIPATIGSFGLADFEQELLAGCVLVNESLYDQMAKALHGFTDLNQPLVIEAIEDSVEIEGISDHDEFIDTPNEWLPKLRNPDNLFMAYSGRIEKLTKISKENALSDLAALPVSSGLSKSAFELCVAMQLLQKPVVTAVDAYVAAPQRFGAVRNFLSSLPCANTKEFNANEAWQTLMRWLLYFLPSRYSYTTPKHSEIFGRADFH